MQVSDLLGQAGELLLLLLYQLFQGVGDNGSRSLLRLLSIQLMAATL
jgi:hypothetical protein